MSVSHIRKNSFLTDDWEDYIDLLSDAVGAIPPECWKILRLAEVIDAGQCDGARRVRGAFDELESLNAAHRSVAGANSECDLTTAEHSAELTIRRIKSVDELPFTDATDLAIYEPDELALKADERELMVRLIENRSRDIKDCRTMAVVDRSETEALNGAEQKIYLLLDRSYSMIEQNRLLFAKAIAIEYLKNKRDTRAKIFYRAFDLGTSQLIETFTREDFDAIISAILFEHPGRKGTDITGAIMTAVADINFYGSMKDAEILLITDGMERLDIAGLHRALGNNIKLHVIKIGFDAIEPEPDEIRQIVAEMPAFEKRGRDEIIGFFQHRLGEDFRNTADFFIEIEDVESFLLDEGVEAIEFILRTLDRYDNLQAANFDSDLQGKLYARLIFLENYILNLFDNRDRDESEKAQLRRGLMRCRKMKYSLLGSRDFLVDHYCAGKSVVTRDRHFRRKARQLKRDPLVAFGLSSIEKKEIDDIKFRLFPFPAKSEQATVMLSLPEIIRLILKKVIGRINELFS